MKGWEIMWCLVGMGGGEIAAGRIRDSDETVELSVQILETVQTVSDMTMRSTGEVGMGLWSRAVCCAARCGHGNAHRIGPSRLWLRC